MFHGRDVVQLHFMGLFFSPRAISQRNVAPALYWQQYFLCIDLTFGGAVCFEALIFLPEPSYTSLCRGWSVASGCVVGDGSALRSIWFFFSKYLFSEWIIHTSPSKYYSLLCSRRVNVPQTANRKTLIAEDNSCCRRIKT